MAANKYAKIVRRLFANIGLLCGWQGGVCALDSCAGNTTLPTWQATATTLSVLPFNMPFILSLKLPLMAL